ncbi:MAG TPA: hypothetical protein VE053_02595 [Allosphingosinicella sp.]|nr:hypothetical protein [Allosphingosinicella sp.]
MKHPVIGAALLLAMCGSAAAHPNPQPQPRGLEEDYGRWRPVAVDLKYGVATFATYRERAGNAVFFRVLKVHRNVVREIAASYDKELDEMLGDCGSRTLLKIYHRIQTGNTPAPLLLTPLQMPAVTRPGSAEDVLLTSACGESKGEPPVAAPYAWAKARLQEGGKQP